MPDFPRYQSKGQLTTQAPSVAAAKDTSGEILADVSKAGQDVQTAAYKLDEARKSTRKTVSLVNNKTEILDIHQRASVETDPNKLKDYLSEIEKSRVKNIEGLDPLAALELNYDSKNASIQLDNLFQKKSIELDTIATKRAIALEVNNPSEDSFQNIKALLDEKVAKGFIDPSVAYAEEVKANDDLGVNRINKDLYQAQTPEEIDQISQSITNGSYEKGGVVIPPDKKKDLLELSDRTKNNLEKKIQAQQTEAIAKGRVDTIAGVASGQIDVKNLDIAEISEFDPQLGTTLKNVKEFLTNYNPKIPAEEQRPRMPGYLSEPEMVKARKYSKSVNDVFMQNDNERLGEFVLREMEKKGDGTTSSVKLAAFMQLAALKFKANNPQTPEDFEAVNQFEVIKRGFQFLKSTNPYLFPQVVSDYIVRAMSNKVQTRQAAMAEAKGALESKIIERYSSTANLPGMPNKISDGEASVDDIHSGLNELEGEPFRGNYGDQDREE